MSVSSTRTVGNKPAAHVENTPVECVQIEGLAVMKILKHCHEDSNVEVAQGALLGLYTGKILEVTNSFGFPKNTDEIVDEEDYQLDMMRRLRRVNLDHYHVGFYQSSDVGNYFSAPFLESQYHYQTSIEESVVLIYDKTKSSLGFLALKAYRMTPQAVQMYKDGDFTPDVLRTLKISYETILMEVPLVIKNSPLMNVLLSELPGLIKEKKPPKCLDLGTASVLESHMRVLMERVDDVNQEAIKFNRYQQSVARQTQEKNRYLQRRAQENLARAAKKEPPLPEEDLSKIFKPIPVPGRLAPMMMASQADANATHIARFCAQSLTKNYVMAATKK